MKQNFASNRRLRYGGISVILTVLLIAAVVLLNALIGTLAKRYQWYHVMLTERSYGVTGACYDLLGAVFAAHEETDGQPPEVEIIFCDRPENLMASATSSYIYQTACSLAERYGNIRITCYDVWLNPEKVRPYMTTLAIDPTTGVEAEFDVTLKSTSLIIVSGSYHRVYAHTEFFVFEGGDTSKVWAYNGEKKLAAGILHAIDPDSPTVCLTNNHGEAYYDYEVLYLLDDAGYRLNYIDLTQSPIPANCDLILCFNPNKDLAVPNELAEVSEPDILDAFLAVQGHSFLVFLENGTPSLPNLEAYLETWGVSACYFNSANGNRYRYMVQDSSGSLTSDGYTIYGTAQTSGKSGELLAGLTRNAVFKNATALRVASGFRPNGDGSYTYGDKTLYSLYETGSSAVAWANGSAVDSNGMMLMTVTEQAVEGGVSRVGVVSSVRFASEEFLQSAVYGNSDSFLRVLRIFGRTPTPEGLTIKPFQSTDMSLVTTTQKRNWTIFLALLPALAVTAIAVPILVRRRYA